MKRTPQLSLLRTAALTMALAMATTLTLSPAPALADSAIEEGAWTLAIASRSRLVRDPSFDLFSDRDVLAGFELSVMRRVWTELSLGLSWQAGGASDGFIFNQFKFDYRQQSAMVTAVYESTELSRHLVGADWLRPTARLEGGVVFGRASVKFDEPAGDVASDQIQWKVAPRVFAGVGLRFVPFSNSRVPTDKDREEGRTPSGYTFALDAEFGWSFLTRMDFDGLAPDPDGETRDARSGGSADDESAITRHPLDLGELNLDGVEFRVGLSMRF